LLPKGSVFQFFSYPLEIQFKIQLCKCFFKKIITSGLKANILQKGGACLYEKSLKIDKKFRFLFEKNCKQGNAMVGSWMAPGRGLRDKNSGH